MPQQLSQRPEESIRQFLVDNIRSAQIQGYDPQQTNPSATDYLPITSDYSRWGETFPMVWVGEQSEATTPGGGESGYNSMQGDGSGPNFYEIHSITVSVQTTETENGSGYLNQTDYDTLAFQIYQEIKQQVQNNANAETTALDPFTFVGITPSTPTREATEEGDTAAFYQEQCQIFAGVLDTP